MENALRRIRLLFALPLLWAAGAQAFDKSYLLSRQEVEDLQITAEGIELNNVVIAEKPSLFQKGLFNLEVNLAVLNRGEKPRNLTVMLAGLGSKEEGGLWAISAAPPFYTVALGTTAPIHGSVYVTAGTLAKTQRFWVRVVGNF